MAGVSSMNIFASASRSSASINLPRSALGINPVWIFCIETIACEASMRRSSDSLDISSEKTATILPSRHRGILGNVDGPGRLAHAGTGGDDDQVGRLQAAGHLVELGVVGGQPGHLFLLRIQIVDGPEGIAHDLRNPGKSASDAAFGNLEQAGFGGIEHHQRFIALVRRPGDGGVADADQLPGQRLVLHDADVLFDAGPARKPFGEGREISHPAHRLDLLAASQFLRQGHDIDRAMSVDQLRHAAVDPPVRVEREVFGAKLFRSLVIGMVIEQDRAQNRTLRLYAGGQAAVQRHIRKGGHGKLAV